MNVLIAEDDFTSRAMLTAVIGRWGFDVTAVEDGILALQALTAPGGPKLAVLDWMMPGLDGVEVCRRMRQDPVPDPPYLIILTSRTSKDDIVSGLNSGADDYIVKPYNSEELKARLEVGRRVIELQQALAVRVRQLEDALAHVKTLQGILPICSYCHKIRSDQEVWERMESYISQHSGARFSHGICPTCMQEQLALLDQQTNPPG
jgi:sigma-B regulation protein RsbU (phosphoserine phosphatase)